MSLRSFRGDVHTLGIYPDIVPNKKKHTRSCSLFEYSVETNYKYFLSLEDKCEITKKGSRYFSLPKDQSKYISRVRGSPVTREYLVNGRHHKTNKPAVTTYYPSGSVMYMCFISDGVIRYVSKYDQGGNLIYNKGHKSLCRSSENGW